MLTISISYMIYFGLFHARVIQLQLFSSYLDEVNLTLMIFWNSMHFAEFLVAVFTGIPQHTHFFLAAGAFPNLFYNLFLLLSRFLFGRLVFININNMFFFGLYLYFLVLLYFSFLGN